MARFMILSDTYQFAFIHIPKCAGTTVRSALEAFDEHYGRMTEGLVAQAGAKYTFTPRGETKPADFHHLVLSQLRSWYPMELAALRRYRSFAVIREPHERLLSSLGQRLRQFYRIDLADLSEEDFEDYLKQVLGELSALFSMSQQLPYDYVHFQPQIDFIQLDGELVVKNLYCSQNLRQMQEDIAQVFCEKNVNIGAFHDVRENTSKAYRFKLLQDFARRNPRASKLIKAVFPARLKPLMRGLFYRERSGLSTLASHSMVRDFVGKHYAGDLLLWDTVVRRGGVQRQGDIDAPLPSATIKK